MNDSFVVGLVSVAVLGGAAQWLGWRLRLPAILLLLLFGMAAGPDGIGLVPTDAMFGSFSSHSWQSPLRFCSSRAR